MLKWVSEGNLARSHRPGYGREFEGLVTIAEVDRWLEKVKAMGVRSIICLLDGAQLALYAALSNGLLEYYREAGFEVRHVPAQDNEHPPLTEAHLEQIWNHFSDLKKPVLIHCSAGVDRTGMAVKEIVQRLAEEPST